MSTKEGIILADEGRSGYTILIDPRAGGIESFAACQLQLYLQKVSGVQLPIKDHETADGKYILVGKAASKHAEEKLFARQSSRP